MEFFKTTVDFPSCEHLFMKNEGIVQIFGIRHMSLYQRSLWWLSKITGKLVKTRHLF
jgi:hypothetical protein